MEEFNRIIEIEDKIFMNSIFDDEERFDSVIGSFLQSFEDQMKSSDKIYYPYVTHLMRFKRMIDKVEDSFEYHFGIDSSDTLRNFYDKIKSDNAPKETDDILRLADGLKKRFSRQFELTEEEINTIIRIGKNNNSKTDESGEIELSYVFEFIGNANTIAEVYRYRFNSQNSEDACDNIFDSTGSTESSGAEKEITSILDIIPDDAPEETVQILRLADKLEKHFISRPFKLSEEEINSIKSFMKNISVRTDESGNIDTSYVAGLIKITETLTAFVRHPSRPQDVIDLLDYIFESTKSWGIACAEKEIRGTLDSIKERFCRGNFSLNETDISLISNYLYEYDTRAKDLLEIDSECEAAYTTVLDTLSPAIDSDDPQAEDARDIYIRFYQYYNHLFREKSALKDYCVERKFYKVLYGENGVYWQFKDLSFRLSDVELKAIKNFLSTMEVKIEEDSEFIDEHADDLATLAEVFEVIDPDGSIYAEVERLIFDRIREIIFKERTIGWRFRDGDFSLLESEKNLIEGFIKIIGFQARRSGKVDAEYVGRLLGIINDLEKAYPDDSDDIDDIAEVRDYRCDIYSKIQKIKLSGSAEDFQEISGVTDTLVNRFKEENLTLTKEETGVIESFVKEIAEQAKESGKVDSGHLVHLMKIIEVLNSAARNAPDYMDDLWNLILYIDREIFGLIESTDD